MSLKSLFSAKDMTQGPPWKRILEFSIPMLIGNIAQQLYNTADSIIVGMYVGDNALAAVGSAMPIPVRIRPEISTCQKTVAPVQCFDEPTL